MGPGGWRLASGFTAMSDITSIGISASLTACPSRGYGRAGTQTERLSEAARPYTPRDGHAVGDAEVHIILMALQSPPSRAVREVGGVRPGLLR